MSGSHSTALVCGGGSSSSHYTHGRSNSISGGAGSTKSESIPSSGRQLQHSQDEEDNTLDSVRMHESQRMSLDNADSSDLYAFRNSLGSESEGRVVSETNQYTTTVYAAYTNVVFSFLVSLLYPFLYVFIICVCCICLLTIYIRYTGVCSRVRTATATAPTLTSSTAWTWSFPSHGLSPTWPAMQYRAQHPSPGTRWGHSWCMD
mgnify:CR=1 FL=1